MTTDTKATLRRKAAAYRRDRLEGGEGYNPYQTQLNDLEAKAERDRPRSATERRDAIVRELNITCGTTAQESRLPEERQAEEDRLRAELAIVEAEVASETAAAEAVAAEEWTLETTKIRRAEWNAWVKSLGKSITARMVADRARAQGWWLEDLRAAIQRHGI